MIEAEERNAHYLSKAREDPYSLAILEVAKARLDMVDIKIKDRQAINLEPNQVYYYLGMIFALEQIVKLPELAQELLKGIPENEETEA